MLRLVIRFPSKELLTFKENLGSAEELLVYVAEASMLHYTRTGRCFSLESSIFCPSKPGATLANEKPCSART